MAKNKPADKKRDRKKVPNKAVRPTELPRQKPVQEDSRIKDNILMNQSRDPVNPMVAPQPGGFARPFGIPIPKELSQVPTYINDPAKLSGDKGLSPFRDNPTGYNIAALDPNINPENTTPVVQQQTSLGLLQQPGLAAPQMDQPQQSQPQADAPVAQPAPQMATQAPVQADMGKGIASLQPAAPQPQQPPMAPQRDPVQPKPQVQKPVARPDAPAPQAPVPAQPQVSNIPRPDTNKGNGTIGLQVPGTNPQTALADPLRAPIMQPQVAPLQSDPTRPSQGFVPQRPDKLPDQGFAEGGFTGNIPEDKPAGIVHGGEYVFPAEVVDALGIDFLEGLKNSAQKGFQRGGEVPGYASGGAVAQPGMLTYEQWLAKHGKEGSWATPGIGDGKTVNPKNAYNQGYVRTYKPPAAAQQAMPAGTGKIVAGSPEYKGQVNVADYASTLAEDPSKGFTNEMKLSSNITGINENAAGTNISKTGYGLDEGGLEQTAAQGGTATAAQAQQGETHSYEAQQTQEAVEAADMEAAQGALSEGAIIDESEVAQHDVGAHARGETELGQALNDYASQDLNAVDPQATMRGQLEMLQNEFLDPVTGEPKIPAWAAATARGVSKLAAFKGMTGTAATAAMSQAMLEASLPIAQQEAQFFQTLTIKNLDNKQASIINKANVLSKMELTNVDNRMAAVIQNSKNFMEMDMKNLDNRQQAQVLNHQARVQSIFEDAKSVNTQRMFTAESQNEMDKFYSELGTQVEMFNAQQKNGMTQFNVSEKNAMKQFNANLENNREQFEKEMSFNIDVANAKWRQTVTLTEADQRFQAAATDVRNMVDMSTEQLNRLWDRSDNLLQFIHTSSENEMDRKAAIAMAQLKGKMAEDAAEAEGWGSVFGSVAGKVGEGLVDWIF